jgi:putative DNA primase/helicase
VVPSKAPKPAAAGGGSLASTRSYRGAISSDALSVAIALGGDVVGRDAVIAPGPGHSPRDRSLSVKLTADGPIVHSFAGDDWQACRDHVKAALGIPAALKAGVPRGTPGPCGPPVDRSTRGDYSPPEREGRTASALRIWREAMPITGTLAERYLQGRKLPLDVDGLRFHPYCPFGSDRLPCVVALYRDIITNEPKAIHRTALTPDGEKIDRKALGPKAGCAIKLTPDDAVATGLTIAEGIETALAGMALGFRPAWALGDAGEIAKFPVLPGVECLSILVDNDHAGQNAALECSKRWTAAGREVFRVVPIARGQDMADVVFGRAA